MMKKMMMLKHNATGLTMWLSRHQQVSLQHNCSTFVNEGFSHLSSDGKTPKMVDVSHKKVTKRTATARTTIRLPAPVLKELKQLSIGNDNASNELMGPKGPIATTATIAGVLGAKQTSSLIPFCHPLPIEDCQVRIIPGQKDTIEIECEVCVTHKTGVEMEALTGASIAALCVYDMCKALSHDIVIETTRLINKTGGKNDYTHVKDK
jgi:cyclic pyranopterin phosphate synthase